MKIFKKNAFTLIEVLVSVLIFSLIVGGLYSTLVTGNRSWATYNNSITVQRDARNAVFAMTKELREAKNILITEDSGGLALNFYHPGVGSVSYLWAKTGSDARKIIRKSPNKTWTLANHVSSLSFKYIKNAVIIDITSSVTPNFGRGVDFHLKGKAALRLKTSLIESSGTSKTDDTHENIK